MEKEKTTLLLKNLPRQLNEEQVSDLLRHFGAGTCRFMGHKGRMKHMAFANFNTTTEAENCLKLLHQADVLGYVLRVEYANQNQHPATLDTPTRLSENSTKAKEKDVKIGKDSSSSDLKSTINFLSTKWDIPYAIDESLKYSYPAPTETILRNILHCLASVPKFYVQVLHLMNKMNLPHPFTELTTTPPLPKTHPSGSQAEVSSEESELESSDSDSGKNVNGRKRKSTTVGKAVKKRLKLQIQQDKLFPQISTQACDGIRPVSMSLSDVFEREVDDRRRSALTLPSTVTLSTSTSPPTTSVILPTVHSVPADTTQTNTPDAGVTPFGKISKPVSDIVIPVETVDTAMTEDDLIEDEERSNSTPYITFSELSRGRLPESEHASHPVLKKYNRGDISSKLYIKNLAKQTTQQQLRYIFGRYVDWSDPGESSTFHIRHMTEGRMKGQAFITLPHKDAAETAVTECHAFVLNDKPMSVAFAKFDG